MVALGRDAARTARQGPRPLPVHLTAAVSTWLSSQAALPLLRNGSLAWRPSLQEAGAALLESLAKSNPEQVAGAIDLEIRRRFGVLLTGIERYRHHPYRRDLADPPEIWRDGTTRLLDYGAAADTPAAHANGATTDTPGAHANGATTDAAPAHANGADAQPLLVVPSLINRAYILDLSGEVSLLRWLAAAGLRPYLVDWDGPGAQERDFTLTDYIAGRLEAALDAVLAATGRPPVLVGYCMGGDLALALAQRRQRDLDALVLMATPWDFHAGQDAAPLLTGATWPAIAPLLEVFGEMPVDVIQALFAGLDPLVAARKFLAFARFDPDSARARAFVALEDWLNDGVALARPVAEECLGGWYSENTTGKGTWRIAGQAVDPAAVDLPALCMIPDRDRIVPPPSALALAEALPSAAIMRPALGHIGMVVSPRAKQAVWQPLLIWLRDRARADQ